MEKTHLPDKTYSAVQTAVMSSEWYGKMPVTQTQYKCVCHLKWEAPCKLSLHLLQGLLLEFYLILLPVFIRIHWGVRPFCFCVLAMRHPILKVLWEDMVRSKFNRTQDGREKKKRLAGFIFVCQIRCPYTGDKFYGALWGLLQLSEHRIPQKEAWCLLLHKGPSRLDSGLNAVSRKENFLLGESLWWGQVTPSSWREYVSTMTQKAPDAIENTSSF